MLYGLLFKLSGGKSLTRDKVENVLGKDYHNDFCEIKVELKLDISFYDYFNKCFKANTLAAKKEYFKKFYERRDKYRYLINKVRQGKIKLHETFLPLFLKNLMVISS